MRIYNIIIRRGICQFGEVEKIDRKTLSSKRKYLPYAFAEAEAIVDKMENSDIDANKEN